MDKENTNRIMLDAQRNAFESSLGDLGLRYWEYDIRSHRLYRSALVQNEVGYNSYKENVPESYVEEGIIHPDYAQAYLDFYHNIQNGHNDRLIFRSKYSDNTWGWLDISYKVLFDDEGRPFKAIGVGGDISWQRENEEKLRKTEDEKNLIEQILQSAAASEYDFLSYVDKSTQNFITYSSIAAQKVVQGTQYSATLSRYLNVLA